MADSPMTRHLKALLLLRHSPLNSWDIQRWALAFEVGNAAGYDSHNRFDAVAIDLWPSNHLAIHVFEIKQSRSDLRRELANPPKTQAALDVADYFWLVTPPQLTKGIDLPDSWGLLQPTSNGQLRTKIKAPLLPEHEDGSMQRSGKYASGNHGIMRRGFAVGTYRAGMRVVNHQDRIKMQNYLTEWNKAHGNKQ